MIWISLVTVVACKELQALVVSQGGVGSTNFFNFVKNVSTNDQGDKDGLKHIFPFRVTFGAHLVVNTSVGCVKAHRALVIVGNVRHAAKSVVRHHEAKHINKLRAQLGWSKLSKVQIEHLGEGIYTESGMYEFQKAWRNVSSPLVRVVTTQELYGHIDSYKAWLSEG